MATLGNEIKIHKKENWNRDLTITQDGSAYDLTGLTKVMFSVRECYSNTPVISKSYTSFPSPELGILSLSLSTTETNLEPGDYLWDIKLFFSDGNQYIPEELPGDFTVLDAITQETS